MPVRLAYLLSALAFACPVAGSAQSLENNGTITEVSGARVIVEHDAALSVGEGAKGRIFVTKQIGNHGKQDIVAGVLRVETVSGPLIIGRITDRSELVDVAKGQHVSFQTGASGGVGGTLTVRSTPSGASVQVTSSDGSPSPPRSLGTTPARDSLSSGQYTVGVTKDGYDSAERTVRIRPGADRTLDVPLERRAGFLVVRPTPDTATVFIDGERQGKGTVRDTLAAGEHSLRVDAPGYRIAKDTVQVASAETRAVQPALERSTGTLKVRSEPSEAEISIDGSERGQTPLTTELSVGRYVVELTKDRFATFEDTVTIRGGSAQEVDVELKRPINVNVAPSEGPVTDVRLERVDDRLHIRYGLEGEENAYDVELEFSHDGGETYRAVDPSSLEGDVGDDVSAGQNKEIRWSVLERYSMGLREDSYRLRLKAEAPFSGGFTIELLTPSDNLPSFGGGVLGWTTKNGYFVFSYSRLTRITLGHGPTGVPVTQETTVNSFGLRAGPVWRLGWLSLRPVGGVALRGGEFVTQGGSSLYLGRSFYVGTKVLYSTDFDDGSDWGGYLTMGVAL